MTKLSTQLTPRTDVWDWQLDASCRDVETDLFFARDGEKPAARRWREQAAKRICGMCPVLTHCRRHAITVGEPFGVWGGTTESDRHYNTIDRAPTRPHNCRDRTAPTRRLTLSRTHPRPGRRTDQP
ncbi:WhiB family transcriptional regulator [Rhodococcus koreensis]